MHMYLYISKETVHKYHFETTKNDRKRVATDNNILSFIYIDVKGFSFKFGKRNIHWLQNARPLKLHFYIFPIFYYIKRTKKETLQL